MEKAVERVVGNVAYLAPPPRQHVRPPTLSEGWLRVLNHMADECTVTDWACRIGCYAEDVEIACKWLGVSCRPCTA